MTFTPTRSDAHVDPDCIFLDDPTHLCVGRDGGLLRQNEACWTSARKAATWGPGCAALGCKETHAAMCMHLWATA